jgi:hypothetical protein
VIDAPLIARRLAVSGEHASAAAAAAHDAGWLRPHAEREDCWIATEVIDVFAPAHQPA